MSEPIIIEQHSADGAGWLVSFDGSNPSEGLCLPFKNRHDAELVKKLVWSCWRIRDLGYSSNSDWKQWAEDAIEDLPLSSLRTLNAVKEQGSR